MHNIYVLLIENCSAGGDYLENSHLLRRFMCTYSSSNLSVASRYKLTFADPTGYFWHCGGHLNSIYYSLNHGNTTTYVSCWRCTNNLVS